MISIFICKPI